MWTSCPFLRHSRSRRGAPFQRLNTTGGADRRRSLRYCRPLHASLGASTWATRPAGQGHCAPPTHAPLRALRRRSSARPPRSGRGSARASHPGRTGAGRLSISGAPAHLGAAPQAGSCDYAQAPSADPPRRRATSRSRGAARHYPAAVAFQVWAGGAHPRAIAARGRCPGHRHPCQRRRAAEGAALRAAGPCAARRSAADAYPSAAFHGEAPIHHHQPPSTARSGAATPTAAGLIVTSKAPRVAKSSQHCSAHPRPRHLDPMAVSASSCS
mmetsp:Transcript_13476/g.34956  ORF Transcript_13476/g.34956 Transcript_13476/m.34956 type:complete len:270 (+) Transcript_13476:757-1566(+)